MKRRGLYRSRWGLLLLVFSWACQGDVQHDDESWRLEEDSIIDAGHEGSDLDAMPRVAGELCDVSGQQGRCAKGRWRIQEFEFVCEPLYRAMPEICNGEDSDCDGLIDYGDDQTPYNVDVIHQRMAAFAELGQRLIDQGVAPERLARLEESRVCPDFRHCYLLPSYPEEPVAQPYESVLDEFDAFVISPPNSYPGCTAD